jgi:hypothetical protein
MSGSKIGEARLLLRVAAEHGFPEAPVAYGPLRGVQKMSGRRSSTMSALRIRGTPTESALGLCLFEGIRVAMEQGALAWSTRLVADQGHAEAQLALVGTAPGNTNLRV